MVSAIRFYDLRLDVFTVAYFLRITCTERDRHNLGQNPVSRPAGVWVSLCA
jgi:hypothetical protein